MQRMWSGTRPGHERGQEHSRGGASPSGSRNPRSLGRGGCQSACLLPGAVPAQGRAGSPFFLKKCGPYRVPIICCGLRRRCVRACARGPGACAPAVGGTAVTQVPMQTGSGGKPVGSLRRPFLQCASAATLAWAARQLSVPAQCSQPLSVSDLSE